MDSRGGGSHPEKFQPVISRQKRDDVDAVFGTSRRSGAGTSSATPAPSRMYPAEGRSSTNKKVVEGKGWKKGGASAAIPRDADLKQLVRKVMNCLSCGKVFDCRNVTNDNLAMVASGACTFCGTPLPLEFAQGRRLLPPAQGASDQAAPDHAAMPSGSQAPRAAPATPEEEAATARAIEFKNRLVDFDRNSTKRTTVLDDQSDYFEIDSNQWLTPEERTQLMERQRLEEEAAEARKRRILVTVDLIGRQVLMANDAPTDASVGFVLGSAESHHAASTAAAREKALLAAEHTAREIPQGGGTATEVARRAASGRQALRDLHVAPNPELRSPAPVFLPRNAGSNAAGETKKSKRMSAAQGGPEVRKGAQQLGGIWAKRAMQSRGVAIIQEDAFDRFVEATEVLYADTVEAEAAAMESAGIENVASQVEQMQLGTE